MLHRVALIAVHLLPGAAAGRDWQRLDGAGITAALTARVLGYPDGTLQDFHADGRTLVGINVGEWKVEGDLRCLNWVPSEYWSCENVDAVTGGNDIRFTAEDGTATIGRHVDLN